MGRCRTCLTFVLIALAIGIIPLLVHPFSSDSASKRPATLILKQAISEDSITVVFKTFLRPGCARRLVQSIRAAHQKVQIIVGDDSPEPLTVLPGSNLLIPLPPLQGCAYGKNHLISYVTTPFVIFVDDDMLFPPELRAVEWVQKLDLLGADLVALTLHDAIHGPFGANYMDLDTLPGTISVLHRNLTDSPNRHNCRRSNYIIQAFAARTSYLKRVHWDPALKTAEHEDFMLSLQRAGALLYICFDIIAEHSRDAVCNNSQEYMSYRLDVKAHVGLTLQKWNFSSVFLLATHFDLVSNGSSTDVTIWYEPWNQIRDPVVQSWFAERAIRLYNNDQTNWNKRRVISIGPVWMKRKDVLGGHVTVRLGTEWYRPSLFLKNDAGRQDVTVHFVWNNDSLPLWYKFCHLQKVREYTFSRNIYVVTAVKTVAAHFLTALAQMLHIAEGDSRIIWVVVDFHSLDLDVLKELQQHTTLQWKYIRLEGPFCRSHALNVGIRSILEPDPLVWVLDAAMHFTGALLDMARLHVQQGESMWAPIYYGEDVSDWIHYGFGMVSFYRSDFERIGGYNESRWGCKYGGEDLDLVEQFQRREYIIFRTYEPSLVHVAHSRHDPGYAENRNDYGTTEPVVPITVTKQLTLESILQTLERKNVRNMGQPLDLYQLPRGHLRIYNARRQSYDLVCDSNLPDKVVEVSYPK